MVTPAKTPDPVDHIPTATKESQMGYWARIAFGELEILENEPETLDSDYQLRAVAGDRYRYNTRLLDAASVFSLFIVTNADLPIARYAGPAALLTGMGR